jgi:ribosomal protein L13E
MKKIAEDSKLAYFVYQSHKLARHLLVGVDIRRANVDEGTKQSFEKTKKRAHKIFH